MKPSIEVYIDKLVLEGHDKKMGRQIGAALEQQLAHLLKERSLLPKNFTTQTINRLDAGQITQQSNSRAMGSSIANSIYNKLTIQE